MLNDMKKRHILEAKKTIHFLKYALGNRAAVPAKNIMMENSIRSGSVYGGRMTKLTLEGSQKKLPFLSS